MYDKARWRDRKRTPAGRDEADRREGNGEVFGGGGLKRGEGGQDKRNHNKTKREEPGRQQMGRKNNRTTRTKFNWQMDVSHFSRFFSPSLVDRYFFLWFEEMFSAFAHPILDNNQNKAFKALLKPPYGKLIKMISSVTATSPFR